MKALRVVIEHMNDTLAEAKEYCRDYIVFKDDFPKVAQTSLEMANAHLNLYDKWHTIVVDLINKYKLEKGDIPEVMKEIWDYKHERLIEEYEEIKYKLNLVKNY